MELWYGLFNDALREIRGTFAFRLFFVRTLITSSPPDPMDLVRRYLHRLAPRIQGESDEQQLMRALRHLEYILRKYYQKTNT